MSGSARGEPPGPQRRLALIVCAAYGMGGCAAVRPTAAPPGTGPDDIATVVAGTRAQVDVEGPVRRWSIAGQERGMLLSLLTLGLWPNTKHHEDVWRFTVTTASGTRTTFEHRSTRPVVCGWLAGPLALLPGWSFAGIGCGAEPESADERAHREAHAARALANWLSKTPSE